ncbi:MAG: hypothetical protein MHMPM18_001470 [Marteilia pararefringens]
MENDSKSEKTLQNDPYHADGILGFIDPMKLIEFTDEEQIKDILSDKQLNNDEDLKLPDYVQEILDK